MAKAANWLSANTEMFRAYSSHAVHARALFFRENNGFIVGIVAVTLLFMLGGRIVLWILPAGLALVVAQVVKSEV